MRRYFKNLLGAQISALIIAGTNNKKANQRGL